MFTQFTDQPIHRSAENRAIGNLFPDFSALKHNQRQAGRVFSVTQSSGVGAGKPAIRFDQEAWEKCQQEPGFEENYQLSMARLFVQIAAKLYS